MIFKLFLLSLVVAAVAPGRFDDSSYIFPPREQIDIQKDDTKELSDVYNYNDYKNVYKIIGQYGCSSNVVFVVASVISSKTLC